jgi:hypothetical protein
MVSFFRWHSSIHLIIVISGNATHVVDMSGMPVREVVAAAP